MRVSLTPHPHTPSAAAERLEVHVERDGLLLWLRFVVNGEVDRIEWPSPAEQGRADDLWRHTCFEAFVLTDDGYVEFNLSPPHRWASYRFDSPRVGMRQADEVATILGLDGAFDMGAEELQTQ